MSNPKKQTWLENYQNLSPMGKFGVWGSVASVIGLLLALLTTFGPSGNTANIEGDGNINVQGVNGNVTINEEP